MSRNAKTTSRNNPKGEKWLGLLGLERKAVDLSDSGQHLLGRQLLVEQGMEFLPSCMACPGVSGILILVLKIERLWQLSFTFTLRYCKSLRDVQSAW